MAPHRSTAQHTSGTAGCPWLDDESDPEDKDSDKDRCPPCAAVLCALTVCGVVWVWACFSGDDGDEEAQLMAELARIKKEREEQKQREVPPLASPGAAPACRGSCGVGGAQE